MAVISSGSGTGVNPPSGGQEYTNAATLQRIQEHIRRGVVVLKRFGGVTSRLAFEPGNDATHISVRAPDVLASGSYHLTLPDDVPAGTGYYLVATPTSREVVLEFSTGTGGTERSGTSFPITNLYTGRKYYHDTYFEDFTYHDGTGLPGSTPVWLGELQNIHFGTTQASGTSGTQSFFGNGSVLGVKNARGISFGLDIMAVGLDVQNGDGNALSGTFTVWAGSSSLISQSWSSETRKTTISPARATTGNILTADFAISGGTLTRISGILRFRHVITA